MKSNNQILNEIVYGTGLTAFTSDNSILNALADGSAVLPIKLEGQANNYKSIVGKIVQNGTDAPILTLMYDDCNVNLSTLRIGAGEYKLSAATDLFTENKTWSIIQNNYDPGYDTVMYWASTKLMEIYTGNVAGEYTDNVLKNGMFEIRVYN